jgi:hypothetical protein
MQFILSWVSEVGARKRLRSIGHTCGLDLDAAIFRRPLAHVHEKARWSVRMASPRSRRKAGERTAPYRDVATKHSNWDGGRRAEVNRPGFVGGSHFQIGWSRYEQNNEQILP